MPFVLGNEIGGTRDVSHSAVREIRLMGANPKRDSCSIYVTYSKKINAYGDFFDEIVGANYTVCVQVFVID